MFEQVEPVIGPYASRPAAYCDYDPRAADAARQIAAMIVSHYGQIRVEHVGSTSVPGCAGKGIVDLMIAVSDGQIDTVKELLDRLGFQHQTGQDAFPEDRPMRIGSWTHDDQTFLVHVHVIPASSPEVDGMRFFRACLRSDPQLLKAYTSKKREIIAGGVTDASEYCRLKGEFLKEILG